MSAVLRGPCGPGRPDVHGRRPGPARGRCGSLRAGSGWAAVLLVAGWPSLGPGWWWVWDWSVLVGVATGVLVLLRRPGR